MYLKQSTQKAAPERIPRHGEIVSRLMPRDALTVNSAQWVPAGISVLLRTGRPAAVAGFVVAVVVDAIKRMYRRWTSSHVRQEVREVLPAVTYGNAPPAVIPIRRISRIAASLSHLLPGVELWVICQPVNYQPFRRLFEFKAIATPRFSVAEVFAGHGSLSAAITAAAPHGLSRSSIWMTAHGAACQDGPATESLSGDVDNASQVISILPY